MPLSQTNPAKQVTALAIPPPASGDVLSAGMPLAGDAAAAASSASLKPPATEAMDEDSDDDVPLKKKAAPKGKAKAKAKATLKGKKVKQESEPPADSDSDDEPIAKKKRAPARAKAPAKKKKAKVRVDALSERVHECLTSSASLDRGQRCRVRRRVCRVDVDPEGEEDQGAAQEEAKGRGQVRGGLSL